MGGDAKDSNGKAEPAMIPPVVRREWMQQHARDAAVEKARVRRVWRRLRPMFGPVHDPMEVRDGYDPTVTSRCDCGHFWNDHGPQGCTLCPCTFTMPI